VLAATGFAADPPAEPKKPVPRKIPVVEIPGIRFEADFAAGRRRATREGKPIFFAVNALDTEPGNQVAATSIYPARELGDPSRGFVCFVCNPNAHPDRTLADGTVVCGRYGVGTCACHKEALAWLLRRHAPDGETLTSPGHFVFEPDGALVWHGEYVQSAPTPAMFDAWSVRITPRLAMRRVWTARDARLSALSKRPAAELDAAARAWLAENDPLAAAGLVAMLDQEADPARRATLFSVLATAGPDAAPLLFDSVDAATSDPDADPAAAKAWTVLATAVDPALGRWALARAVVRSKDPAARSAARERAGKDAPAELRARVGEALLLAGDASAAALLEGDAKDVLPAARIERARRAAGTASEPAAGDVWWEDRARILTATVERVKARRDELLLHLEKKGTSIEIRVASALALRRVGDGVGVPVLLWALADSVEGPETRAELARMAGGSDLGDDPSAWEAWLRGEVGEGGGK
jgi:hypothetical protein